MNDLISRGEALNTKYIVKSINGVDYVMLSEVQMKLRKQPSAQPEIIRCKDCRWGREVSGNIECFTDTNAPPEYHGYEWFCPNGKRRTDENN